MRRIGLMVASVLLLAGAGAVWAHEGHEEQEEAMAPGEQELVGEVVDVNCYLSHGKEGLGAGHADCAKKCIKNGLPVAIKVGDKLYLATMADHTSANKALAQYAGQQIEVHGKVLEGDGQRLVAISAIEAR